MKKILVAPLNWGLGHASRCIPLIAALIKHGYQPVMASDGQALELLKKEFPGLEAYELPSYNIRYSKNGKLLNALLIKQSGKILKAIKREQEVTREIIEKEKICGIISDNRFGVRSDKVYSVYITHQLRVLSGLTTFLTSRIHQQVIKKFDACWVPDHQAPIHLSGKLSHPFPGGLQVKYIGPLSRLEKVPCEKEFDLMVILSGPEPQRSILEEKLRLELKNFKGSILFVQGLLAGKQTKILTDSMLIVNFMLKTELQECICKSRLILARSGYSTLMDLEKLEAKAFFIPTPGQTEQVYLAKYLKEQKIADYVAQNAFNCLRLEGSREYTGFRHKKTPDKDIEASLFDVFKEGFKI